MASSTDHPGTRDETLVERARDGDMNAFEELVMRHADRLYMALRRFGLDESEAQEVAQETFLRAWRSLARFEGRSRFYTWLYRIGFNEAQRRLGRRRPAELTIPADERTIEDVADLAPGPADSAAQAELRATLASALRELPVSLRAAVVLRDVEGLSTSEAASILELGEAAFKSRLHRGRMALRDMLDGALLGPRKLG